jgi:hypothetical protein
VSVATLQKSVAGTAALHAAVRRSIGAALRCKPIRSPSSDQASSMSLPPTLVLPAPPSRAKSRIALPLRHLLEAPNRETLCQAVARKGQLLSSGRLPLARKKNAVPVAAWNFSHTSALRFESNAVLTTLSYVKIAKSHLPWSTLTSSHLPTRPFPVPRAVTENARRTLSGGG